MGTCSLIIKDEVNIKLVGLPVDVRRKLVKEFKYFKPYARHIPAVKLGRWDGSVTFFTLGGDGFLSQLPRILPILEENDIEITDIKDLRRPMDIKFPEIKEDFWGDKCWPAGHPMAGQPIRIREHQLDALNLYAQNPQSIQSLPTSSGKTIISSTLAKMCEPYGRTVTIVPSKSLVEQTNEDFVNCGLDVGLYYGDVKDLDKTHTICTWQAVSVLVKKAKKGDNPEDAERLGQFLNGVSAVIVDECFAADSPVLTPSGYKPINSLSPGDKVVNYNEKTKSFKHDTIVKVHQSLAVSENHMMFELQFNTGRVIRVTGNHKFLTRTGWKPVHDLSETDSIVSLTIDDMKIANKLEIEKPEIVYNLHIENDHNYIVNNAVVANCHGLKAEELKSLLLNYLNTTPIRWAMTGTIPKEVYDAECLYNSIGPLVNKLTAKSLQDAGILSTCNINVMQLLDIKKFKNYADEIRYLVTHRPRIEYLANVIQSIGETGNTLVLVSRIDTGQMLEELIPGAVFISGDVKTKDRKEEYDAFKTENCKILIATTGIAAVGINIISLYNLVMVEPGKSFVRVIQSIGRGLRKGFDKDHVEIWDITSTSKYSKKHLTERKKYYDEMQYKYTISKIDWEK